MKLLLLFFIASIFSGCTGNESPLPVDNDPDDQDTIPVQTSAGRYFYVAPNGNDNQAGTIDHPWATWQKAFRTAIGGDTVLIRGGVYQASNEDELGMLVENRKGTLARPICIFSYPGETPVLDCSSINRSDVNGILLKNCRYFHLKGLTLTGVKQNNSGSECNGFALQNTNGIILENCISHGNAGPGFFVFESDTVYFINCDAYDNFDQLTSGYSGGQADGFVVCYAPGSSFTILKGCRSWFNSDDGYDCWENEGVVVYENCQAFNNGRGDGDGGGFKLGKTSNPPRNFPQRILKNCLAFDNQFVGFNQNGADVIMTLYNCIAHNNDNSGFELSEFSNLITLRNNISFENNSDDGFAGTSDQRNNSWNNSTGVSVSSADFVSVSPDGMDGNRQADGSLPVTSYLHLAPGSDLINAGVDVGIPFIGSAPDLGAFEKE